MPNSTSLVVRNGTVNSPVGSGRNRRFRRIRQASQGQINSQNINSNNGAQHARNGYYDPEINPVSNGSRATPTPPPSVGNQTSTQNRPVSFSELSARISPSPPLQNSQLHNHDSADIHERQPHQEMDDRRQGIPYQRIPSGSVVLERSQTEMGPQETPESNYQNQVEIDQREITGTETIGKEGNSKETVDISPVKCGFQEDLWDPNHWTATLHCCVCFEFFQGAYVLPCGHTFCNECMEMLVKTEYNRNNRRPYDCTPVICPTCRYTMPYYQYTRYAPRNRALEAVIDAWKASGDRTKLSSPKVERGLQINLDEEEAITKGKEPAPEQLHMSIQTEDWPEKKIQTDVGQQVSLPAPGYSKATQAGVQTRDMPMQTRKAKYRSKDTQTRTAKSSIVGVQAGEPGIAFLGPPPTKVNSAAQCSRAKVDTRFTQTLYVKKKKFCTVRSQTDIQSSSHLRNKKGEPVGPWIACNPTRLQTDPILIVLAVFSIFILFDWRDIASKFVTDVPTVLSKDYYTWYTVRFIIESLMFLLYGVISFCYILITLLGRACGK